MIVEVLFSVLIMLGLWVRGSAFILAGGMLVALLLGTFGAGTETFVYMGIYIFLLISGGGSYAMDAGVNVFKSNQ